MSSYRAAVVQAACVPFDAMASAEKAAGLIREAADGGARLILFPEVFIGTYPKGASFSTPVGMRQPTGRRDFQKYHANAILLDGSEVTLIAEAARDTGVFVIIGCLERDGGTLYCTVLFFDGENGLVGKHRKLMPTGAERIVWGFGDGSTMPVFETSLGRIGAVICWENYMPMMRMAMYSKGISIYCAPTADDRDGWAASMQHIALEGRCFVLSSCQRIKRGAFPSDYECALGNDPETVLLRGGSMIVSPLGEVLAGPNYEDEVILYAEIDLGEVIRGKYDFDVAGHYSRPDVFRLEVDDRPHQPVVFRDRDS